MMGGRVDFCAVLIGNSWHDTQRGGGRGGGQVGVPIIHSV